MLSEIKSKEIQNKNLNGPPHILIEGDNYHALSVLNYTHRNKIDVIYIDPPYNTGAKDWKYNNHYVDAEDGYRHSKWLSFMHKRLRFGKYLLKKDGVMIITIDNNELFSILGLLQNLEAKILGIICIIIKPEGRNQDKYIMGAHEYAIFATWGNPSSRKIKPRAEMKQSYKETTLDGRKFRWDTFYRRGDKKKMPENESRWYEIFVDEQTLKIHTEKKHGCVSIFPIDTNGSKWIWGSLYPDFKKSIENLNPLDPEIIAKRNGSGFITIFIRRYKQDLMKPLSYWNHPDYSPQAYGAKLVANILQKNNQTFNYPKSVFAVYDCLDIFLPRDGIVLDFFAGSGTTGHATLQLNKDDGGHRKFILCTDNENNICTDICYPRIKNVIKGYKNFKGEKVAGLGSNGMNLKYFKTNFVESADTDKNKKKLVDASTEMLCLKEGCFDIIKATKYFTVFTDGTKNLVIIYDYDGIKLAKKMIKKLRTPCVLYIFSLDEYDYADEFEDLTTQVKIRPIPVDILNLYRRLFR